jgi:hypothetical protein
MKETIRAIPIILILPGTDIIVTVLTTGIIDLLSKESTDPILTAGTSTMTVLNAKIIGMEGIDSGRELHVMGSEWGGSRH